MNFKVLIIGGTGFIGEYLVKKIHERKNLEIHVAHRNLLDDSLKLEGVHYSRFSFEERDKNLLELINTSHFIAVLTQPFGPTIEIIKEALEGRHLKKLLYVSTNLLYEETGKGHTENSAVKPLTEYEIKKYQEEKLLEEACQQKNFKLCICRLSNIYGDVKNKGIVNFIMNAIKHDADLELRGDGNHVRDYLFVEDAALLLDFVLFKEQENYLDLYNISSGIHYTINEVVQFIEENFNFKINRVYKSFIKEKKAVFGDNEKIMKSFDGTIKYDLVRGIEQTLKNYNILKQ